MIKAFQCTSISYIGVMYWWCCVCSGVAVVCVCRVWISTTSATESQVQHIDFGNQQTVLTRDLFELPAYVWDIPPAAVPCRWVRPGMQKSKHTLCLQETGVFWKYQTFWNLDFSNYDVNFRPDKCFACFAYNSNLYWPLVMAGCQRE